MIVCRTCANANSLDGIPHEGTFECGCCGGAGRNAAFVVPEMTPAQVKKARDALDNYHERMLDILRSGRGYDQGKPS